MNLSASKLPKVLLVLALVAFISLSIFGLSSFNMPMGPDGHMAGCPFMGMAAVCHMSPFEHISAWQHMFTATAPEGIFSLLLSLLSVAILFVFYFDRRIQPEIRALLRYRPRNTPLLKHSLQEAFSNGILNTKVY